MAGEDQKRMQGPHNRPLQEIVYPTARSDVVEVAAGSSPRVEGHDGGTTSSVADKSVEGAGRDVEVAAAGHGVAAVQDGRVMARSR